MDETNSHLGDFSVAYELSQVGGTYSKRDLIYADLFRQRPDKKKKVIELIMKVKSNKYKEKVEIPMNAKVALSDIDLVIQEVLNKPMVNIKCRLNYTRINQRSLSVMYLFKELQLRNLN